MNPYPIDQHWRKGYYVARVTGPHARYTIEREFLRGKPIKSRQTLEYRPDDIGELPAWLIRTAEEPCPSCGRPEKSSRLEVLAAFESGWESYGKHGSHEILEIHEAGPPGAPGAWQGDICPDCQESPIVDRESCEKCSDAREGRQAAHALAGDKETPF